MSVSEMGEKWAYQHSRRTPRNPLRQRSNSTMRRDRHRGIRDRHFAWLVGEAVADRPEMCVRRNRREMRERGLVQVDLAEGSTVVVVLLVGRRSTIHQYQRRWSE